MPACNLHDRFSDSRLFCCNDGDDDDYDDNNGIDNENDEQRVMHAIR